jgi:cytochrome c oxidase subunit 1
MSAVVDNHDHGHGHGYDAHHDHHGGDGGIRRWITTTNYKDIGTMYLVFGLTMFVVGFANMAYEILSNQPGSPLWS